MKSPVDVLKELAKVGSDEFVAFDGMDDALTKAINKKLKEKRAEQIDNAAGVVVNLLNDADQQIEYHVKKIREFRASVKTHKDHIESLKLAKAYGIHTSNYLPLAYKVSYTSEYHIVPVGWQPDVV